MKDKRQTVVRSKPANSDNTDGDIPITIFVSGQPPSTNTDTSPVSDITATPDRAGEACDQALPVSDSHFSIPQAPCVPPPSGLPTVPPPAPPPLNLAPPPPPPPIPPPPPPIIAAPPPPLEFKKKPARENTLQKQKVDMDLRPDLMAIQHGLKSLKPATARPAIQKPKGKEVLLKHFFYKFKKYSIILYTITNFPWVIFPGTLSQLSCIYHYILLKII